MYDTKRDNRLMTWGTIAVVASIILLLAGASEPAPAPEVATKEDLAKLAKRVEDTDRRLESTGSRIDGKADASELQKWQVGKADRAALDSLSEQVAANRRRIADHDVRLDHFGEQVGEDRKLIADQEGRLDSFDDQVTNHRRILDAIAQKEGSTYLPRIEGNLTVGDFANEMERVVKGSVRRESTLYITNETDSVRYVLVNE